MRNRWVFKVKERECKREVCVAEREKVNCKWVDETLKKRVEDDEREEGI